MLVDSVVRKMHARIANILFRRLHILFRAHANQSIVKKIHPQGLHRAHKTVDAEIELVTVQQKRLRNVQLSDHILMLRNEIVRTC